LPLLYDAEALSVFCSCGVLKFLGPAGLVLGVPTLSFLWLDERVEETRFR